MSNQIEQIRAEIERRNLANYCVTAEHYEEELLAILDTIEADAQAQPVPADVQEAADKYIGHPYEVAEGVEVSMRRDAYAAGMLAERERLMKEAAYFPEYDSIVNKVFGAGNLESWELDEAKRLVRLAKDELLKELASCPAIKGWVARDGHGALVFSNEKPSRLEWCGWKLWKISRDTPAVVLPNSILSDLRWEDEPKPVRVIIEEIK